MRIQQDSVLEIDAEQLRYRSVQAPAGQVPPGHIDAARHFDPAPALRVGVEHVVEVHLDGQRIFADQDEIRRAPL
jgi:hypothetical protein